MLGTHAQVLADDVHVSADVHAIHCGVASTWWYQTRQHGPEKEKKKKNTAASALTLHNPCNFTIYLYILLYSLHASSFMLKNSVLFTKPCMVRSMQQNHFNALLTQRDI